MLKDSAVGMTDGDSGQYRMGGLIAIQPLREASCARCHFGVTPVGAAAMGLPTKSVLYMSCHGYLEKTIPFASN